MNILKIVINEPKKYFLPLKKSRSMRIKMETRDTLVSLVGIFETRVKPAEERMDIVTTVLGTNTGN